MQWFLRSQAIITNIMIRSKFSILIVGMQKYGLADKIKSALRIEINISNGYK